jgi:ribosomal protein S27AE
VDLLGDLQAEEVVALKLNDFECPKCGYIFESLHEHDETIHCGPCGAVATKLFSAPVVQTIETHMRGTNMVSHGGYFDHALRDRKTGKYPFITSKAQKDRILKEKGFVEVGPTDVGRQRERDKQRRIYG